MIAAVMNRGVPSRQQIDESIKLLYNPQELGDWPFAGENLVNAVGNLMRSDQQMLPHAVWGLTKWVAALVEENQSLKREVERLRGD